MINKKNVLGQSPFDLGDKDAIHVAIVAVRAGKTINPGERCKLNEHREAVPDTKGVGVADPFLKDKILVGDSFWLLLGQDAVPNVQHVWDHPTVDFTPPSREIERNRYLQRYADGLGVTYDQLMKACQTVVDEESPVAYPGTLVGVVAENAIESLEVHDVFYEWKNEVGHEFENHGSECCPEYNYPRELFFFKE